MMSYALALTTMLMAAQPGLSATERELTRVVQRLASSWKNGDCDAWGGHLAPDWSVIHTTGAVITKAQALAMCRAPEVPIESFTVGDLSIRSFDTAAVVTGVTTVSVGGTRPQTIRLRFTDVFVHRQGRWLVVASHATRLTPEP